jgi:hypothetical protein
MTQELLLYCLLFWVLMRITQVWRHVGGLSVAYFLTSSLNCVPGVMANVGVAHTDPLYQQTYLGFAATLIGLTAFCIGALIARLVPAKPVKGGSKPKLKVYNRISWRMIGAGAFCYFVLIPLSFKVPSLTSLVSPLGTLMILGFWVMLYAIPPNGGGGRVLKVFAMLPALPASTVVAGGFLNYGTNWMVSVLTFQFTRSKARWLYYSVAPVVVFLGLSLFVSYWAQRAYIRQLAFQNNASVMAVADRASKIITDFKFLDLSEPAQRAAMNVRLNQNLLIADAIQRHEEGLTRLAYGATMPLWALIPRVIWPNKPAIGGGGDVVSKYTGVIFANGTSVGAGQVLEFYVNFGYAGIVGGFMFFGFVLMRIDGAVMRALADADSRRLLAVAMPGLSMINPGGNLLEIMVAVAGAMVMANLIGRSGYFDLKPSARELAAQRHVPVFLANQGPGTSGPVGI